MSSARDRVLSIPEVVEQIAINLRRASLSQLRLTCKAFHGAFSSHYDLAICMLNNKQDNISGCSSDLWTHGQIACREACQ